MFGSLMMILVVWLVVLGPLVLAKNRPVRRTSDALEETKLLHRGGDDIAPRRRFRRPAPPARYLVDSDDTLELVDAEPDFVIFAEDDGVNAAPAERRRFGFGPVLRRDSAETAAEPASTTAAETPAVVDGDVLAAPGAEAEGDAARSDAEAPRRMSVDALVVEETADAEATPADAAPDDVAGAENVKGVEADAGVGKESEADAETTDADAEGDATDAADVDATDAADVDADVDAAADSDADADFTDAVNATDATAAADAEATMPMRRVVLSTIDDAYFRGEDYSARADLHPSEEELRLLAEQQPEPAAEQPAADTPAQDREDAAKDLEFAAARQGRGFYDPVQFEQQLHMYRLRRLRAIGVVAGLLVLAIVAAVVWTNAVTILLALACAGLTVGAVRINQRLSAQDEALRRRRLARIRRARMGVHVAEEAELGVPQRLRRPGAVIIETDDADPELITLDYVRYSSEQEHAYPNETMQPHDTDRRHA